MKDKSDQEIQYAQEFFREKPISLAIAHLLRENEAGMTATDLAKELHVSVPTLYRTTLEMYRRGLLDGQKEGRKTIYKPTESLNKFFPDASQSLKRISEEISSKKRQRLSITKSLLEEYDLILNPKVAETLVISTIKQKIFTYLPSGVRRRNIGFIKTVLDEPIRFDLYLGTDTKFVAIELKIIENTRNLRERLGSYTMLTTNPPAGLKAIIVGFILVPNVSKWEIDDKVVINAINSLGTSNIKLIPHILKLTRSEILDDKILTKFSKDVVNKMKEVLKIE